VSLDRWLVTFPSFGYLLSVAPEQAADVVTRFTARGINAAVIGAVVAGGEVALVDGESRAVVRDHAETPLLQLGRQDVAA
jgi:selenophosphate synthetase-related protein